jgi:predicted AAA+ superfamily ATPase
MVEIKSSKLALDSLCIYRNLLKDPVIEKLKALLEYICLDEKQLSSTINLYNDFLYSLLQTYADSLEDYIAEKIIFDENSFSKNVHKNESDKKKALIKRSVASDLENLQMLATLDSRNIKNYLMEYFNEEEFKHILEKLQDWQVKCEYMDTEVYPKNIRAIKEKLFTSNRWDELTNELQTFHRQYGCGLFAEFRAFVWEHSEGKGHFIGVKNPDPVELEDLIGYEDQRQVIIENTVQFLKGFAANNVLLHGDRGTGKSSTVKAILNKYYKDGLRMIEVPKARLTDFPDIIRNLKERPQRFIIFVDDLVFGDDEESYTALKAILEGGLENKSSNILIYATSNRRHLVKEYFNERPGIGEEVHSGDSVQEKLSLADRFGINVVFSSPDQKKFLEIVDGIAAKRNLNMDKETLHREAKKWELWYNGRSARTARQFVDWIEGHSRINN